LRTWHEDLYKAFDEWESIPERWAVWFGKFMKIKSELDNDEASLFEHMGDNELLELEAEMRSNDYARSVIQGRDLIENPNTRDSYLHNVIYLEAARIATERHGPCPNYFGHKLNIPR
jgi:hypothetical protein